MYWFLISGVDINIYPDFFKKKYKEIWLNGGKQQPYIPSLPPEMRNSTWIYWVDVPIDVCVCFKYSPELATRLPYFTPLFSDLILQSLMRNLQKNASMAAASRMIVGQVPMLNKDAKATVKDMIAISPDLLGKFLALVKSSINESINVASAPLEDMQGMIGLWDVGRLRFEVLRRVRTTGSEAMNKTVAIIGGSGFLGRCLSTRLAQAGHNVFAVARSVDPRQMAPGVTCVQATIDDAQALAPVLAEADYLLHLAWDTTPGTSQLQPVLEASNNLLPTLRLLEQMQRFPRCRIVFLSSGGAIYSERCPAPWNEESGLEPRSYYGAGKITLNLIGGDDLVPAVLRITKNQGASWLQGVMFEPKLSFFYLDGTGGQVCDFAG